MIYAGLYKPFLTRSANRQNLFNEYMTVIITSNLMLFLDQVNDDWFKYYIAGYSYVVLLNFAVLVNLWLMSCDSLRPLLLRSKWLYAKIY